MRQACRADGGRAGTIGALRGVAQPGSALRSGRRGPQFKSGHPDCGRGRTAGFSRLVLPAIAAASTAGASILGGVLRAVVFDVDFTLARPGPDLGPGGYRELGRRYGLELDPARYDEARAAAFAEVKRHPELDHDEEIWVLFTERIIVGMGGTGRHVPRRGRDGAALGALGALRALRGRGAGARSGRGRAG